MRNIKKRRKIFSLQITLVYSASVSIADNGFDFLSNVESEVNNHSIGITRNFFDYLCINNGKYFNLILKLKVKCKR
jgi:hypothetical protein